MNHHRSLFLAAVFVMPVCAQDPVPAPKPVETTGQTSAQGPALVLKTGEAIVAMQTAAMFDHFDDLPEQPEGGHYVLSLAADKKLAVTVGAGEAGLIDLVADPSALMAVYAEELEGLLPMARGALTMALQQAGMKPKDAAPWVKGVLDFPKQLQKVALKVVGGPDSGDGSSVTMFGKDGIDATFAVEGKPGSNFEWFVGLCKPSSQGAPVLPATNPAMSMSFSLAPESVAAMLAPFRDLSLTMFTKDEAQKKEFGAIYDQWIALYDGGVVASMGEGMRMRMLIGVLDGAKLSETLTNETYLAMMRNQTLPDPDMEVEVTADALEHRGTKLGKSRVSGGEPSPMMPDGAMESYFGAIANYMVMTLNGDEASAKDLIDTVLDKKVKRAPLAGDSIVHMDVDLATFMPQLNPAIGQGGANDRMPQRMGLSVAAVGNALQVRMNLK